MLVFKHSSQYQLLNSAPPQNIKKISSAQLPEETPFSNPFSFFISLNINCQKQSWFHLSLSYKLLSFSFLNSMDKDHLSIIALNQIEKAILGSLHSWPLNKLLSRKTNGGSWEEKHPLVFPTKPSCIFGSRLIALTGSMFFKHKPQTMVLPLKFIN